MIVVRYADDLVVGFEYEGDARRFLDAMHDRLGEFALSLHPDKTRLIEFGRFAANDRKLRGLGKPETFTFLGFTFICGRSRRGNFQLQRKTRPDRMRGKLRDIKAELRRRMRGSGEPWGRPDLPLFYSGIRARPVAPSSVTVWRRVSHHALRCGPPACAGKARRRHGACAIRQRRNAVGEETHP